ncbi:dystroglycan 1 [Bacillus rossius redtenbacheri]|uniref:dystroglycan 1 n=1 Tax=Bacillus rossius redtenbacheri TaxID=93214 RepID=UPI002FDEBED4
MASLRLSCLGLLSLLALAASHQTSEEDFAFEPSTSEESDFPVPLGRPRPSWALVQRLWGVPDTFAPVGKLLHLAVPNDAFKGDVDRYEASGPRGTPLPRWLSFDRSAGIFEGVPSPKDEGEVYITVRALGADPHNWAKDVFSIEVTDQSPADNIISALAAPLDSHKVTCDVGEDPALLTIVMDGKFEHMKPKQRISAIKNLSGFLGLHHSLFHLQAMPSRVDLQGSGVLMAGPGNVRKKNSKYSTALQWQVGCDGHVWRKHSRALERLKLQAQDGTLAEVLQQPVVGWHVRTEPAAARRSRREVQTGSGDGDDYEYYDYGDDVESATEPDVTPEPRIIPTMSSPTYPQPTDMPHLHRHHHGESPNDTVKTLAEITSASEVAYTLPTSPVYGTILPTPVLVPVRPTQVLASEVLVEATRVYNNFAEITPSATPVLETEVEPTVTTEQPTMQVTEPLPSVGSSGVSSSEAESSSGTTTTTTTTITTTTTVSTEDLPATEESSTTEEASSNTSPALTHRTSTPPGPDEEIVFGVKNIPPNTGTLLPRLPVTAGKAIRYVIPENAFSDLEDGSTRNLQLTFLAPNNSTISPNNWLQFNPETQEVYGLPLDENVSRWPYILEATDREGAKTSQQLVVWVQQHKGSRAVHHEFSLHLRLEKKFEFPSVVDWEMHVLDSLARLYGDADTSQITVRNVSLQVDPIIFSWTNDSLPRTHCPKKEIDDLFKVMVLNDNGDPSTALKDALLPSVRVKKVTYRGLGQCEPAPPPAPPRTPQDNFPPVARNQVDHINATVGQLLVFKVPEDSFYDPEDGSARHLKLSLLTMNRMPIDPTHWLQFDAKNQEFYGIPSRNDEGRREYQLVCEDSAGLMANDGLVVVVHPAPASLYNVEFRMKLNIPYESFVQSAAQKRKFVEKVGELFDDHNTSTVVLKNITQGSTVISWFNRSLPVDHCPHSEIRQLKQMLIKGDGSTSERVAIVMGQEFPVVNLELVPMGLCQGGSTRVHEPEVDRNLPVDETAPDDSQPVSSSEEYLVTFIVPAVIIAAMLLLAGAVACVLYRRRRTGKMNVGEEDERQSFRNKGIPVIFQDELEERPDPGNKSPVIMKEEKPPLPPPEYQRGNEDRASPPPTAAHPLLGGDPPSDDAPYQPPPPFTSNRDSGRHNRPMPTPIYRKPPPYVPP